MVDAPQTPAESLVLGQFSGLKNTVSPERLSPAELERAENIDLDDAGQARRRRGYVKKDAAPWHSLFTVSWGTLGVRDGVLVQLNPDYSFRPLVPVGADRLDYAEVSGTVYFSSRSASGKVNQSGNVGPWGAEVSPGQWLSPVVRPTETLGAVRGAYLGAPPLATHIAYYNGRIYLAHENTLWATMLYQYDFVDKTRTFFQFEHPITDVGAVSDGLYVGTENQVFFLSGQLSTMSRVPVTAFGTGMASGSLVVADVDAFSFPKAQQSKSAVAFVTPDGICVGLDRGETVNVTHNKVWLPKAVSAAPMLRGMDGAHHYVVALDHSGGPSAAMRIGDWVDFEVRRFRS